jgi:hypothetical protein
MNKIMIKIKIFLTQVEFKTFFELSQIKTVKYYKITQLNFTIQFTHKDCFRKIIAVFNNNWIALLFQIFKETIYKKKNFVKPTQQKNYQNSTIIFFLKYKMKIFPYKKMIKAKIKRMIIREIKNKISN